MLCEKIVKCTSLLEISFGEQEGGEKKKTHQPYTHLAKKNKKHYCSHNSKTTSFLLHVPSGAPSRESETCDHFYTVADLPLPWR